MHNYSNEDLIQSLQRRYAVKKFDANRKIPQETVDTLLESVRLTPTSYGLQLMKVILVENPETRAALLPHSFGQTQITEASHLIILCREHIVSDHHVSAYISEIAKLRNIEPSRLDGFKNMMLKSIQNMNESERNTWMTNQVYIALGNLLTSCAVLGIDACPMEGFLPEKYSEVLHLAEDSLYPSLVIPVGYRSEDDKNATLTKVRRPWDTFVIKR